MPKPGFLMTQFRLWLHQCILLLLANTRALRYCCGFSSIGGLCFSFNNVFCFKYFDLSSVLILWHLIECTGMFLNFGTTDIFAVIYLKFKQRCQTLGYFVKMVQNGIANSKDPDQTAPLRTV